MAVALIPVWWLTGGIVNLIDLLINGGQTNASLTLPTDTLLSLILN